MPSTTCRRPQKACIHCFRNKRKCVRVPVSEARLVRAAFRVPPPLQTRELSAALRGILNTLDAQAAPAVQVVVPPPPDPAPNQVIFDHVDCLTSLFRLFVPSLPARPSCLNTTCSYWFPLRHVYCLYNALPEFL